MKHIRDKLTSKAKVLWEIHDKICKDIKHDVIKRNIIHILTGSYNMEISVLSNLHATLV